jgi:hypothetical protein
VRAPGRFRANSLTGDAAHGPPAREGCSGGRSARERSHLGNLPPCGFAFGFLLIQLACGAVGGHSGMPCRDGFYCERSSAPDEELIDRGG